MAPARPFLCVCGGLNPETTAVNNNNIPNKDASCVNTTIMMIVEALADMFGKITFSILAKI